MICIVNSGGGGAGGTLTVTAPAGVTVTASKDGKTYTRTANAQGVAVFKGLKTGVWSVTISDGVQNPTTMQVEITADYALTINFFMASISVTYPEGSTCKCAKGSNVLTAVGTSGSYTFTVPEAGDWAVSCTNGADTASKTVTITTDGQSETVNLAYSAIPDISYTGDYEIVNDADEPITRTLGNWKIRFLTSGTLTVNQLRGAENGIDVFLVGGGSGSSISGGSGHSLGGGSGGFVLTEKNVPISVNTAYPIEIGAGGGSEVNGGTTSAFGKSVNGGNAGTAHAAGGNGASGGGGGTTNGTPGVGGSDGSNGGAPSAYGKAGTGNGETTREFGEPDGKLYSGGGAGAASMNSVVSAGGEGGGGDSGQNGGENTGGGAGGVFSGNLGGLNPTVGGSGIVVIRNAREVA